MHKIIYEQPAPAEELSPAVERVLRRAMEKEPAKRYQSARAFAEDLGLAMLTSGVQGEADIFHARPQPSKPEVEKTVITTPPEEVPVPPRKRGWGWIAATASAAVVLLAVGAWVVLSGSDGQWRRYLADWGIVPQSEAAPVSASETSAVITKPVGATYVLSDFEIAAGGWQVETSATILQRVRGGASQGAYWLKVMNRSLEYEPALAVRLFPESSDWSRFGDTLAVDIFLPARVTTDCRATVALVDSQGQKHTLPQPVMLRPGSWVNVEWRAGDLLLDVKSLLIEVENLPVGDTGWFGIDHLRVYRTQ
jgi:hypothetical protein